MTMKKRATRKSSASPLADMYAPSKHSPKSIINKKKRNVSYSSASALFKLKSSPPVNKSSDDHKTLTTISDLKDFAYSQLDDIKRNLIDRSHSEILQDLEASHSRLHKRFKIQTQTCQQLMDEAEKEYKKMTERISESQESMKASYSEFLEDAQVTASRVCKTSIEELSKSFNKEINNLRSNFGMPAA